MADDSQEFTRNIVRCISRLERQRRRYLDENLHACKLYGAMFFIVLFLDREPGSSQDDLVEFLGINKSGITRKCRRMEDLGYIRREQSQEDRRQNKLYLTGQGRELLPVIRGSLSNWRGIATKGMDINDQKELLRLLECMLHNTTECR